MDYLATIRNFISENFLFGDDVQLDNDTSFLDAGIIDSTGVLELISFVEETYNIKVDDEEIIPENFDSLKNVSDYLEQKINGAITTR
jgi:acyl carrier protein